LLTALSVLAATVLFFLLTTSSKTYPGPVPAQPAGLPRPASGWTPVFADSFNLPLAPTQNHDNVWFPSSPWARSSTTPTPGNSNEVQFYAASQAKARDGQLVLTPSANPNKYSHYKYLSGQVSTPTFRKDSCSHTKSPCYQGWHWLSRPGAMWDFETVAQLPNDIPAFPAFWTDNDSPRWTAERDFFELHPSWTKKSTKPLFDTSWIYRTHPLSQQLYSQVVPDQLGYDPTLAFHRYDYLIYPNRSWSLYIDGVLQRWVGTNGIAPPAAGESVNQMLRINYALLDPPVTSSSFRLNYVAVYEDTTTASLPKHPFSSGQLIAPHTSISSS